MDFKKAFISELSPAKYNPRKDLTDKDPEYQRIKRSIEEFGYVDPVIVNADYTVIGGHQRLKVLKELGHAQIDVVVVDIPKDKEKALNIALNKISGEWDTQRLTDLLGELKADGMDISITGFDEKEFDGLLRELHKDDEPLDTEPQISRAEELRKEWGTEVGQLWQCGSHFVICGDCTDPAVVERVMGDEKADICITSPPYNAGTPGWENKSKYHKDGDNKDQKEFYNFLVKATEHILFYSESAIIDIQQLSGNKTAFIEWLYRCEQHIVDIAIWDKGNAAPAMEPGVMSSAFEYLVFLSAKKNPTRKIPFSSWRGKHQNIHRGDKQTKNENAESHRATFPIHLPQWGLEICDLSKVVLDPFLGSGTTMIACENLGRKCRGCEISPEYVAVILQRYKDTFPGKEIRLL